MLSSLRATPRRPGPAAQISRFAGSISTSAAPSATTIRVVLPSRNSSSAWRPWRPMTTRSQSCSCSSCTINIHGSAPQGAQAHVPCPARVDRKPAQTLLCLAPRGKPVTHHGVFGHAGRCASCPRTAARRHASGTSEASGAICRTSSIALWLHSGRSPPAPGFGDRARGATDAP